MRFFRNGETISRQFHQVLRAINALAYDIIRQVGNDAPRGPVGFEGVVGAIDGTHILAFVPSQLQSTFRNRKGTLSQTVMVACCFDLNFQYVLPGWERSATDARVLQNALSRPDPLVVPQVLRAINALAYDIIRQVGNDAPREPVGFEGAVGAIDGTHIPAFVPSQLQSTFRNRKGTLSQTVMVACGFDLNFQYVLPGWEGSTTDARVLQNALSRPDPLVVPRGRYYLVDGGYANQSGFLAPYQTARYHLADFRRKNPVNSREVFNKMHSQARNVIERAFGILRNRFGILKTAPPYDIHVQVDIVIACCVLHNFIRMNGGHTFDEELLEDHLDDVNSNEENDLNSALASADEVGTSQMCRFSQREKDEWSRFRENLKGKLWNEFSRNTHRN